MSGKKPGTGAGPEPGRSAATGQEVEEVVQERLHWPPPFRFHMALPGTDVLRAASDAARQGALGAADVLWCDDGLALHMALVLEPDRSAREALLAVDVMQQALHDALAALLPPQVAIAVAQKGRVLVNGGEIGRVRHMMPDCEAHEEPPWMVVSAHLNLRRESGLEGGQQPDVAVLAEEGGEHLTSPQLVAEVARHFLLLLDAGRETGTNTGTDTLPDEAMQGEPT